VRFRPACADRPQAIAAYEKLASDAGLSNGQITRILTADASPNGERCAFYQKDFVSGVQLLMDKFSAIIGGNGALNEPRSLMALLGTSKCSLVIMGRLVFKLMPPGLGDGGCHGEKGASGAPSGRPGLIVIAWIL